MNVMIVGSGAREHALAWKLRQSPRLTDLFVAPGNGGTAAIAHNLPIDAMDSDAICRAATDHRIELVVVGPEAPLAAGLVDRLAVQGIAAFGPTRDAARIESSKAFAKDLMRRHGIPTAHSEAFTSRAAARDYVESHAGPLVVKADGLAAGKGVFVCDTTEEALHAVDLMLGEGATFGRSGSTVLIEERLSGREVSAHAFTRRRHCGADAVRVRLQARLRRRRRAQYRRNGRLQPAALARRSAGATNPRDGSRRQQFEAMREDGSPYRGVLYPGIIVTADGPRVLEFNARLGDPETQVLLPRLKSDLLEICWAVVNNRLVGRRDRVVDRCLRGRSARFRRLSGRIRDRLSDRRAELTRTGSPCLPRGNGAR